jgi:hypothetical protein
MGGPLGIFMTRIVILFIYSALLQHVGLQHRDKRWLKLLPVGFNHTRRLHIFTHLIK